MKTLRRFIIFFMISSITLRAQDKIKTLLLIDIEEATINGDDVTKIFTDNKAYITFYKNLADSTLSMASVWPVSNSQSFGNVIAHPVVVSNETYQGSKAIRAYYEWHYSNTYNEATGTAFVELIQIVKPEGVYYVVKMSTNAFELLTFKGYLDERYSDTVTEN